MSKDSLRTTTKLDQSQLADLQKQVNAEASETRQLKASEVEQLNRMLDSELSRMYADKAKTTLHALDCAIRNHADPDALISAHVDGREFQVPQRILRLFRYLLRALTKEDAIKQMRPLIEIEASEYEEEEYEAALNKLF